MFATDGVRRPELAPSAYVDPAFFVAESRAVFGVAIESDGMRGFVPGHACWHLVATLDALSDPGSYVATAVVGVPVVVRNAATTKGPPRLVAFVNTCLHRASALVLPGHGRQEELTCRYHGWRYDDDGRVSHLPDGRSFKGLKLKNERLCALDVTTFGSLVFVRGRGEGPSLRDAFAPVLDELSAFYERPLVRLGTRATERDVNWKVVVENAVESYHVPMVHAATFEDHRDESLHDHRLDPRATRYADLKPLDATPTGRIAGWLARILRRGNTGRRFVHTHVFPNLLFYYGDLYCDVSVVTPIGPTRMRHVVHSFAPDDLRERRVLPYLRDLWGAAFTRFGSQVFTEDLAVWEGVQHGLVGARGIGSLSAREERVWAFQEFVRARMEHAD